MKQQTAAWPRPPPRATPAARGGSRRRPAATYAGGNADDALAVMLLERLTVQATMGHVALASASAAYLPRR